MWHADVVWAQRVDLVSAQGAPPRIIMRSRVLLLEPPRALRGRSVFPLRGNRSLPLFVRAEVQVVGNDHRGTNVITKDPNWLR